MFSGIPAVLTVHAGAAGVGFVRGSGGRSDETAAETQYLTVDTSWTGLPPGVPVRNTTLATAGGGVVATVEHVLSALAGLGVWSARVHLDGGPETPILDGSALPFVEALRPVLVATNAGPSPLVVREPVQVTRGDSFIRAEPSPADTPIEYTYSLDYGAGAAVRPQKATWGGTSEEFARAIAPARTFSLLAEARAARDAGLFKHLGPRDMLVIDDSGRPIDNEWRLEDEPARHKLLDLIGDLALLGRPLHAKLVAHKAGHSLAHEFCRAVRARVGP